MHWFDFLSAPEDWLGAVVPVDLEVAASEDAVMFITHLTAYPEGFNFNLTTLTRDDPGVLCRKTLEASRARSEDREEIHLHLGVEFSDGRQASDLTTWISVHGGLMRPPPLPAQVPPDPHRDILLRAGGHETNEREFSGSSWIWPLPPAGLLTFQCGWPAAGLPVRSTAIDAGPLLAAAEKAQPLWDSEDG